MIHGGACSNASLAAKPEIVAADIPWVITASTASSLTDPVHPPDLHHDARGLDGELRPGAVRG